jgi:exopolyphosphatase/pppGpp-phosphohydrolase
MTEFYIDLGSSTIKVHEYKKGLKLIDEHSIYFKNDFSEESGLSNYNKKELYAYFEKLIRSRGLKYENTHIYATGIFRNLSHQQRQELVREFNDKFDLHFEVISHGIENYYLGRAMDNNYGGKKVMIVNMGGKTTELIIFKNNVIADRKNLKIGVAELLNEFPGVNDKISSISISEMNEFIKEKIKDIKFDQDYACAIFTGGEERFETLTNYNLVPNTLFDDGIHEFMVSYEDYIAGTERVFNSLTIDDLHNLMPQNPKWMDGARAGAILPLAIFELANIKIIVPSDLNLINGVINDIDN